MSTVTHIHKTEELRRRVVDFQRGDKALTQTRIAKQSGIGVSRLNQWLKGTYAGDNQALERDLSRWLGAYQQREIEEARLPQAPEWVETPTAKRVLDALRYAQMATDVAVIHGGAGLGKTKACEHYAETRPSVFLATMCPATAGVVPALEEVATAIGIVGDGGGARIHRGVVKYLTGTHGLLVIDEAQHLNAAALDQMRSIHDAAGVGLALVGNEQVYTTLRGGTRAAYLDRLFSRVGKRLPLSGATKADVQAVIQAWEIQAKDCQQALIKIAQRPGGLRVLTKVLRMAATFAAGRNATIVCEDIKAAWNEFEESFDAEEGESS